MKNSQLSDTGRIIYEETSLSFLAGRPYHFRCGIYIICTEGSCEVSTGAQDFLLTPETELIFLTGTLLQRGTVSGGFKARMLVFPNDTFMKAMLPIDTPYLNYAHEHPCYCHTDDSRSRLTWKQANLWMDVAEMLFTGRRNQFTEQQEHNFLQGLLMWLFNTIPEKIEINPDFSRQHILCHRFMQLIREYGAMEHSASFYAEKLCISTRYLHKTVTSVLNGKTPKELIDEQLVAETKVLLCDPGLTVTEIAEQLNFADQSYLTRFFKRHTGLSPKQYRSRDI